MTSVAAATPVPKPDDSLERTLIVVPTYNESANIPELVRQIFASMDDVHVLIVDDNSPDGTAEIVEQIRQPGPPWNEYGVDIQAVELDQGKLLIRGLYAWKLYEMLPAYLQWLQTQGCTETHYDYAISESN